MKRRLLLAFAVLILALAAIANAANIDLGGSVSTTGTAILGASSVVFASDANHTLSVAEYTNNFLEVTSGVSLTVQRSLIAPLVQGQKFDVQNATTGGQSILVIGTSGAGVVIPNGATLSVVCDGTNYLPAGGAPISWPIQVADGGTGNTAFNEGGLLVGNNQSPLYTLTCANGQAPVGSATGMVCGTVSAANQAAQSITASGGNVTCLGTTAALTCSVNAPVSVPNGGTGDTNGPAHSVALWEGTSSMSSAGPCSNGQPLVGPASGDMVCGTVGTSYGGMSIPSGDMNGVASSNADPTIGQITGPASGTLPLYLPTTVLDETTQVPNASGVVKVVTNGTVPQTVYYCNQPFFSADAWQCTCSAFDMGLMTGNGNGFVCTVSPSGTIRTDGGVNLIAGTSGQIISLVSTPGAVNVNGTVPTITQFVDGGCTAFQFTGYTDAGCTDAGDAGCLTVTTDAGSNLVWNWGCNQQVAAWDASTL